MVDLLPGMMMIWAVVSSCGLVIIRMRQPARRKGSRSSWLETRGSPSTPIVIGVWSRSSSNDSAPRAL